MRFKWMIGQPDIKALGLEMESVKTNLLILMHAMMLEWIKLGDRVEGAREEI